MDVNEFYGMQLSESLCCKLNFAMKNILKYNPSFKVKAYPDEFRYKFFNAEKRGKGLFLRITCDFEFCIFCDERLRSFEYMVIEKLWLTPRGKGIGTELMKIFIREIVRNTKINCIYLFPKDRYAKRFWARLGFEEDNNPCSHIGNKDGMMVLRLKTAE